MKILYTLLLVIITPFIQVDSVSYGSFVSIEEIPFIITSWNISYEYSGQYYVASSTGTGTVSLSFYEEHACGGAIISEFYVITAAHCIDDYEKADWDKIHTGKSLERVSIGRDGSKFDIEKIFIPEKHVKENWEIIHEDYTDYDIALIKLKDPIQFGTYQQPIKISSIPPKGGDNVTICGFGSMGVIKGHSPSLRKSEVTVIDYKECKPFSKPVHVPNSLFCAGNGATDVCAGDSGSPVIINRELVGIVSSGPECAYYPTHDRSPGLYARVDLVYDWIMKVTGIRYV